MKHLDEPWPTTILFATISLILYIAGIITWYERGVLDAEAIFEFIVATVIMLPVLIAFFVFRGYDLVVDNIRMYLKAHRRFKR
jgi:hypothetical protein